jgi:hypothetical protein
MNTQPVQPISADSLHPDFKSRFQNHDRLGSSKEATVEIDTAQLAAVAELLHLLDGFLRSGNGVAERLADYLRATGNRHPQLQDLAGCDANLLVDLLSFTSYGLRWELVNPERFGRQPAWAEQTSDANSGATNCTAGPADHAPPAGG